MNTGIEFIPSVGGNLIKINYIFIRSLICRIIGKLNDETGQYADLQLITGQIVQCQPVTGGEYKILTEQLQKLIEWAIPRGHIHNIDEFDLLIYCVKLAKKSTTI